MRPISPKKSPGPRAPHRALVTNDLGDAVENDEELVRELTLADEDFPRRRRPPVREVCDLGAVDGGDGLAERGPAEVGAGHGGLLCWEVGGGRGGPSHGQRRRPTDSR